MGVAVFPFPDGKSRFASWILEYVPDHTCFVEVFGGTASVLVNKDPRVVRRGSLPELPTSCNLARPPDVPDRTAGRFVPTE